MLELEQLATTELGLSDDMMIENAAQCIAQLSCKIAEGDRVVVLAGNTKSGARAIAAARQLRNHGMRVHLLVLGIEREEDLLEIVKRQLSIYRNSGGQVVNTERLVNMGKDGKNTIDLVVDALLGMHLSFEDLRTADRNAYFEIASWVNPSDSAVLAVDVPSGLDASTGETPKENTNLLIRPSHVLALGAPKTGLLPFMERTRSEGVQVWVADIGISNSVWKKFGTRKKYGVAFGGEWVAELAVAAAGAV
ncbi:MAG: hypothetical protein Q9218_008344 [Villophora microphyllina]